MAGIMKKRIGTVKKMLFTLILLAVLIVVGLRSFILEDRLVQIKARHESVKCELEAEKNRTEELANLKLEIKTKKFIEETAREKFGLTYQNEIVFEPEN